MKKCLIAIVGMTLCTSSCYGVTSYFRTPLSFIESRWGTVHYPFPWLDDCDDWEIDAMGVIYKRNACDAFGQNPNCIDNNCSSSCSSDNDKVTRQTVSLSQLWFGQESFLASDVFANSQVIGPSSNPFLSFVKITPNFSYNESGAAFALNAVRKNLGCDKSWFIGGRIAMPIAVIEVNQRNAGSIEEILPDFSNVSATIQQMLDGLGTNLGSVDSRTVRAYRLDFLSGLQLPDGTPMIQYGTIGGTAASDTMIAGQDITTNASQVEASLAGLRAPMYVYKHADGVFPIAKKGLNENTAIAPTDVAGHLVYPMINASPNAILNAAGSNLTDGQFGAFGGFNTPASSPPPTNEQQDYAGNLGTNVAVQRQLFLVPVMPSAGSPTFEAVGLVVQNTIERVIEDLMATSENGLVIEFFKDHGIDFESSDCSTGAGDTFLELYGGKMRDCWFADALVGLRLPTGTNADDPKRIYQQTTGNNGHFATKIGAEGGYMPCNWFGIKLDFFWSYNFSRNEKRAAAFIGSTTRNIGPCIDARVKWNEFQAHVDFTFFSPRSCETGWDFGYELYAKTNDQVCFCQTQAVDFNGDTQFLDASILEKDTNTQSHKLRAEFFNRWGCFELFLGGSYIIAGRQVMKEAECHLGMKAYF